MTTLRWTLGTVGVALLALGGVLLVSGTREGTAPQAALWLAGAVALHDLLLAPLVLLIGRLLVRPPLRGVLRGALVVTGSVTLIALPVLLRPGLPANPSVLPLDYPRNWALIVAGIALAAAVRPLLQRLPWPILRQLGQIGRFAPRRKTAAPNSGLRTGTGTGEESGSGDG